MKLTVLAVGHRLPAWADQAIEDFLSRFPRDFSVAVRTVKPEPRAGHPIDRLRAAEADRLRALLPSGAMVVALDETGTDWNTRRFAQELARWRDDAEAVAFLIGGADGLDPSLLHAARLRLRLSSLTLSHALARVVLAEQIYRAWSIIGNHPYHRE